jgi:hypothetical protein
MRAFDVPLSKLSVFWRSLVGEGSSTAPSKAGAAPTPQTLDSVNVSEDPFDVDEDGNRSAGARPSAGGVLDCCCSLDGVFGLRALLLAPACVRPDGVLGCVWCALLRLRYQSALHSSTDLC